MNNFTNSINILILSKIYLSIYYMPGTAVDPWDTLGPKQKYQTYKNSCLCGTYVLVDTHTHKHTYFSVEIFLHMKYYMEYIKLYTNM